MSLHSVSEGPLRQSVRCCSPDRLPEDLDLEHVRDDLLRLAVHVRVHERDVVVARDHVAQRGQPLLDALDRHRVGQRVAQVLQFLVCGCCRDEKTILVTGRELGRTSCSWAILFLLTQLLTVRQFVCR